MAHPSLIDGAPFGFPIHGVKFPEIAFTVGGIAIADNATEINPLVLQSVAAATATVSSVNPD